MGTFSKDTYETGSQAALVGGTTTLIEMCCPARKDDALAGFELWMAQAGGKSACDFTFHMGVTRFDDTTAGPAARDRPTRHQLLQNLPRLQGRLRDRRRGTLPHARWPRSSGVIVTAHCENETLVAERQQELLAAGKTDPGQHHESRPPARRGRGRASSDDLRRTDRRGDLHRPPELRGGARRGHRRAQAGRAGRRRNADPISPPRQNLRRAARTSKARNMSCRRRCATSAIRTSFGTACAPAWSTRSRPTTPRSTSRRRSRWARTTSPKFPTAFPRSRSGSTCSTPTGSRRAGSTCTPS